MESKIDVYWNEEDAPEIKNALARLMQAIYIRDGKPVSHNTIALEINLGILAELVHIIGVHLEGRDKHGLFYSVVFHLRKLTVRDIEVFRRELLEFANRKLQTQLKGWIVLFPLNHNQENLQKKRWFTVRGSRFVISNWKAANKKLEISKWIEHSKTHYSDFPSCWDDPFIPILIEVKAPDYVAAFRQVESKFELLRTAINFQHIGTAYTSTFFGSSTLPIPPLPPAPLYPVFDNEGKFEDLFFSLPIAQTYRSVESNQDQIKYVDKHLRFLNRQGSEGSTHELVVEAFQKYGRSLDTNQWNLAFLGLWQILELVTFRPTGKERYSIGKVRDRVRRLLKPDDPFVSDMLNMVYRRRNRLVHVANYPDITRESVQALKLVVDSVLLQLMNLERICPTWESLVIYYNNAGITGREMRERERILKALRRAKK